MPGEVFEDVGSGERGSKGEKVDDREGAGEVSMMGRSASDTRTES